MNPASPRLRIGTAGWAIPSRYASDFSVGGSALARYASRFSAVEINSTFRRQHMAKTFERWAASVPEGFRFSVKFPRRISHDLQLVDAEDDVLLFLDQVAVLGDKLGPLLLQLPPSFAFDRPAVARFFQLLRSTPRQVVFEPRHASWFDPEADTFLVDHAVTRVAADPALSFSASQPGGDTGNCYFRLHGTPRVYYSDYGAEFLAALAAALKQTSANEIWCIFDNTASGAAPGNALTLQKSFAGRE